MKAAAGARLISSGHTVWPLPAGLPCQERDGKREQKDWIGGREIGLNLVFPVNKNKGVGLAEGLVLQSEDLQMLTHSCVRHITICQLL